MQILFSLLLIMNIVIFHSNMETIFMPWRLWEWIFTSPPLLQRSGRMRWYSAVVFVLLFPHFKLFLVTRMHDFSSRFPLQYLTLASFYLTHQGWHAKQQRAIFFLTPVPSMLAVPGSTMSPTVPSSLSPHYCLPSLYPALPLITLLWVFSLQQLLITLLWVFSLQQFPIICSAFTALMGNGFPAGLLGKVASAACISNPCIHLWTAIFEFFLKFHDHKVSQSGPRLGEPYNHIFYCRTI